MARTRLALSSLALVAAASLVLVPVAATAHTDNLFTWAYTPVGSDSGGFATTSRTDAALALLGEDTVPIIDRVTGIEVCDEVGYAVGQADDGTEAGESSVLTFDHSTGAILTGPTSITLEGSTIDFVEEADTLADCSLLTVAQIDEGVAIISVDPATGVAELVVDLGDLFTASGLATTAAGVTYLFGSPEGVNSAAVVELSTGLVGPWVALAGLNALYASSGFSYGVDFDAAGGLWIVNGVDEEQEYHLTSFAAGADISTATPVDIGILPYYPTENELQISAPIPLSAEGQSAPAPAPAPQLAATGGETPLGLVLAAGILLLGGIAALTLRRRAI